MPSPHDEFKVNIARWEGLYQANPDDPGNWYNGQLIGTMRGVTPAVLQAYLGIDPVLITPQFMREAVTLDVAAEIGLRRYYVGYIDPVYWCAPAAAVMDFGWGSGPGQAIKSTERDLLKMDNANFTFDPVSIAKWRMMYDNDGVMQMLWAWYDVREKFYDLICLENPRLQQFRLGWHNRAYWQTPATHEWWSHWQGETTDSVVATVEPMPSDPLPKAVLGVGSFGAEVLKVQTELVKRGYKMPRSTRPDGSLDGLFGEEMREAVIAFQEAHPPLVADGWIGDQTRRALFGPGNFFGKLSSGPLKNATVT